MARAPDVEPPIGAIMDVRSQRVSWVRRRRFSRLSSLGIGCISRNVSAGDLQYSILYARSFSRARFALTISSRRRAAFCTAAMYAVLLRCSPRVLLIYTVPSCRMA